MITTRAVRACLVVCSLALSVAHTSPGRAQPNAADVYADIKSVIEELITRELARASATQLACYSPNGLLKYFPRTLQLVYERNFGNLRDTLQTETVELLSNYAYISLKEQRLASLREFLPMKDPFDRPEETCKERTQRKKAAELRNARFQKDVENFDEDCPCCENLAREGGPEPYAERLRTDHERAAPGTPFRPLDECVGIDEVAEPETAQMCHLVEALTATGLDKTELATERLARVLATVLMKGLVLASGADRLPAKQRTERFRDGRRTFESLVTEVRRALENAGAAQPDNDGFDAFRGVDIVALMALVEKGINGIWDNTSSADRRTQLIATAVYWIKTDTKPTVSVNKKELDIDLLDMLLREGATAARAPSELRGAGLARALVSNHASIRYGRVEIERIRDGDVWITTDPAARPGDPLQIVGGGQAWLEDLLDAAKIEAALKGLIRLTFKDGFAKNPNLRSQVVRALLEIGSFLDQLAVHFQRARPNGPAQRFDLTLIARGLRALAEWGKDCVASIATPALPPSIDPNTGWPVMQPSLCDIALQFELLVGVPSDTRAALHRLILSATRGDYRAVAVEAFRGTFSSWSKEQACCGALSSSCAENFDLYGRFAISLVSYLMSAPEDEGSSTATRVAFREAAYDLVTRKSGARGVSQDSWFNVRGYPTGTLRFSMSNSYLNDGRDGMRTVASLEWLAVLVRFVERPQLYTGLQVSAVDVIAPLAEIALRDPEREYPEDGAVWANFFTPRVEFLAGWPAFSKHVVATLGVSLRTAIAIPKATGADAGRAYVYSSWMGTNSDGQAGMNDDILLRSLEASIGVKYVP